MQKSAVVVATIAIAAIVSLPRSGFAQSSTAMPPHVPLQKTIGQARTEIVPSLIVFNARGASLQGGKLVLNGIAPNSIVFADRPVRAAGHDTTAHIVEDWNKGSDNFAKDPPNATVSAFTKDGSGVKDAVVVLKSPNLEGDKLTFDIEVLEGDLNGADGAAGCHRYHRSAVYTDVLRRRCAAHCVPRGDVCRRSWGSSGVYRPYGYPPPACGYYPYPPCY